MRSLALSFIAVLFLAIVFFHQLKITTDYLSPSFPDVEKAMMLPLRSAEPLLGAEDKNSEEESSPIENDEESEAKAALQKAEKFAHGSLETQAGQLLMIGLVDKEPSEKLKDFLHTVRPGGFVLFRRNYKSLNGLQKLIQFLKQTSEEYASIPPLIAVDEEGGSVTRLPWKNKPPSAYRLAQMNRPELTKAFGFEIGKVLKAVGFNMNFAPVLDMSLPEQFLKTRAYGNDQGVVVRHGMAYAEGLEEAGIFPVAKHFPGLSPTKKDPHHDKTQHVFHGPQEFAAEISPFYKFTKKFTQAGVMLSHSIYPQFNEQRSAVMSPELISYLKKDLRFSGVVISDDLQMQGISYEKQLKESRIETIMKNSFEAGCDMMLISYSKKSQEAAHRKILTMLMNPKNKVKMLEKLNRILVLKQHLKKNSSERSIASEEQSTLQIAEGLVTTDGLEKLFSQMK